jgi:nitrogen regulatory protein PII
MEALGLNNTAAVELIYAIVNFGTAPKLLRKAKGYGISGGTTLLGRGTVPGRILDFLGLNDVRKEIVVMVAERSIAFDAIEKLSHDFEFAKPNHGIAFTMPITKVCGMHHCSHPSDMKDDKGAKHMYQAITVIVERGKAEDVIDAAVKAGSKGGTIIKGRGSGIHETSKLFTMDIEPEKEIVLILSEADKTDAIVESIRRDMKIDEPGQGILFVQEVSKTYGLYK